MPDFPEISRERAEFLARDYHQGFIAHCGLAVRRILRGYLESEVTIQEHHRQQDGFIHAGVMATMADHSAGYAAFSLVPESCQILTIEFKINFLKPAYGHELVCRSTVIREGKQVLIAESEVFDQRKTGEVLSAKAMITLMAVPRERLLSKS